MKRLITYFGHLRSGKIVLWCYFIWYIAMAGFYFDTRPSLWVNSIGLSIVIGSGLVLSVMPAAGIKAMEKWAIARLFMTPLCVSSFAALIKNQGFFVVFSPRLAENLMALGACAIFVSGVLCCKVLCRKV